MPDNFFVTYFRHHAQRVALAGLVAVWLLIVVTNYWPGNWLLGWDSVMPEFNMWLNLQRSFTPAWQEYQGLGLLGGIGHGAELTRQLMLLPFSFILPTSGIRYLWTFAMLLLGPLGIFFWSKQLIRQRFKTTQAVMLSAAFVAALFYLCNIATVQYFYVPLEAFSSFYGFIPWLLMTATSYLKTSNKKSLWHFALWSLAATSAFHVQTLFVVFCVVLSFFILEKLWDEGTEALSKIVYLLLVIVGVNSFWFLPVGYFGVLGATDAIQARQSLISTPESHLLNKGFGDMWHVLTLQGYWLEYADFAGSEYDYLFKKWRGYLYNPFIASLLGFVSIAAIAGLAVPGNRRTHTISWSLLAVAVFTAGMLTAGTGPLGLIFYVFTKLPLMYQMFRVSFTKWSMIQGLVYSVGLGFLCVYLITNFKNKVGNWLGYAAISVTSLLILIPILPVFTGQLLYNQVQLELPQEYRQMSSYLSAQPVQKRIAIFPVHSLWGWHITDWGYRGSGFIWYGIPQPIVDRNFDAWSQYNEQFYFQLQEALSLNDSEKVAQLLEKYDISYVLVDASELSGSGNSLAETIRTQVALLEEIGAVQEYATGKLTLYSVSPSQSFVQTQGTAINVSNEVSDVSNGNTISFTGHQNKRVYPFADLATAQPEGISFTDTTTSLSYQYLGSGGEQVLNLESLNTLSQSGRLATISYQSGSVSVEVENGLSVFKNDMEVFSMGENSTSSAVIINDESPSSVFVDVQGKPFIIEENDSISVWLANVGKKVDLSVTDVDLIEETEDTVFVDPDTVVSIPVSIPQISESTIPITLEDGDKIRLEIPTVATKVDLESGYASLENCDLFSRGGIAHHFEGDAIVIEAFSRAAACTGWQLPTAQLNADHLVRLKGENIKGRNLKVYFSNDQSELAQHETLTNNTLYDQNFLLPRSASTDEDFHSLNIQAQSLGGEQAVNLLSEILVYELPFSAEQLASIYISAGDEMFSYQVLENVQTQKTGTHLYSVSADQNSSNSLLTLSQSYHPGWLAFPGWRIWDTYEHVEYNGWANGWIIPGQPAATETEGDVRADSSKQLQITILFLPQLLSFAGYGVLILTLAWLGWAALSEKTAQADQDQSTHGTDKSQRIKEKTKQRLAGK